MKKKAPHRKKGSEATGNWSHLDRPQRAAVVPWREMNEIGLILDVNTGDYFEINETALLIWKHLDGQHSIAKIGELLTKTYDVTPNEALGHIKQFLTTMAKAKLVYV